MTTFLAVVNLITVYSLVVYFLLVLGIYNGTVKIVLGVSFLLIAVYIGINTLRRIKTYDFSKLKLSLNNLSTYLLLALITILFIFLYSHPFEEFLGGRDPGVYISIAQNISRNDSIKETLPILEKDSRSNDINNLFHFENRPDWVGHKGYYFLGHYITDPFKGELTPQFFHLPSTIGSIWIHIFGTKNIVYFMPTLAIFVTALIFVFLKRYVTSNTNASLMGLILWLTSPAVLFWGRSFNSEMFVILFVISLMLNVYLYLKTQNLMYALFATVALLAAFLSRGDPLVFILVIFALILLIKDRWKSVVVTLFLSLIFYIGLLAVIKDTYPYFSYHSTFIVKLPGYSQDLVYKIKNILPTILSFSILVLGVVSIFIGKTNLIPRVMSYFSKISIKYFFYLAILLFGILLIPYMFIFVLQIIPVLHELSFASEKANIVKLGWYIGGIAGWFSLIAGSTFLAKISFDNIDKNKKYLLLLAFISVEIVFSLFFIYKSQISLDQPWWSRRYLIPTILLVPIAFAAIWEFLKFKKVLAFYLIGFLFGAILISNLYYASPIIATQKYNGSYVFLERLNSCFGENKDSVIIFDTSYNPSNPKTRLDYLAGNFFGQPLWVYYNRTVYYPKDKIDPEILSKKIQHLSKEKKIVYVINPSKNLLNKPHNFKQVCETTFYSKIVGWGSVFDKKHAIPDLKLSPESTVEISLPVKVYKIGH